MSVYFIRSGATGEKIKIGLSEDPERRAKSLALPGAEVLATVPGGHDKERELHKRFAHLRMGDSEWFAAGNDLLAYLDGLSGGDAGGVAQAVREAWRQADRLARVIGAVAWVLLAAGCSESATAPTPGAWAILAFMSFAFITAFIFARPKRPVSEDGEGEEYAVEENEWQRRQRFVFTKELVGPDGSHTLLAADPLTAPRLRTTKRDRFGNVQTSEELLPHAVYTPETGILYNLQTGTLEVDERLARPALTAKLLKAAGGWPRVAAEQESPLLAPPELPTIIVRRLGDSDQTVDL